MQLANRSGFTAGAKLPYDAEVGYISPADGSRAYFLIDKRLSAGRFVSAIRCSLRRTYGTYIRAWFGYAGVNVVGRMLFQAWYNGGRIRFRTGDKDGDTRLVSEWVGTDISVDESFTGAPNQPLFVFATGNGNTAQNGLSAYGGLDSDDRVYFLKLCDTGGNLVLDLIPVRVGTAGFLYDRVGRKLYGNAGTGAFVIGPDKS